MRIKFIEPDPRAGTIAQMDSSRGRQLVDAGSAVEVKEGEGATGAAPRAPATATVAPVDPQTLTAPELKAVLDARGITYKGNASKADLQALLAGA